MTQELWLPLLFAPNYSISNHGNVRNNKTGRILKPGCGGPNRGYLLVMLPACGRFTTFQVHRLVCEYFQGPAPSANSVIRHLNDISFDNRAENLCWGTQSENYKDSVINGGRRPAQPTFAKPVNRHTPYKLSQSEAVCIRQGYLALRAQRRRANKDWYEMQAEIFGVSHLTIRRIAQGVTWQNLEV